MTTLERSQPLESRATTEQMDVVFPDFGNTVTVTEMGATASILAPSNDEDRATLVMLSGRTPGQVYTLKPTATVLGRDPMADVIVDDSAVSRRHAKIELRNGIYILEDLGSANGTFVGGERVKIWELQSGDRVQLGSRIVLRFALLDEAEERMHRQLFESATRDPLTGAFNKKYITERLAAEVAHSLRHRSSLEIIVLDLDKFKHVNDHYGHLVGDIVLQRVSERIQQLIRSEDVFGRFGGEEFVLLSRGSDAARLAERIRAGVEQLAIPTADGMLHVTLSLGVARLDELGPSATANGLLEIADRRLYDAKANGRNQVRSSD